MDKFKNQKLKFKNASQNLKLLSWILKPWNLLVSCFLYLGNLIHLPAYWLLRKLPFYKKLPILAQRGIATLLTLMVLTSSAYSYLYLLPNKVEAAWFDDSWGYRQRIPINTHTASENNVYNEMSIDTATLTTDKLQADCDDLRFTKQNGETLPYQIVSGCDTGTTVIRVGFDVMPIAPFNIYMYYGNPSASARSQTLTHSACGNGCAEGSPASEEKAQGPITYFKFDEGQGQTINDSGSANNSATLGGTSGSAGDDPTWQTESQCISGKCLYYDGSDDYVLSNTTNQIDFSSSHSFSIWFKYTGFQTGNNGGKGGLFRSTSGPRVYVADNSNNTPCFQGSASVCSTALSENRWYFFTHTYNGSTAKIYIDGVEVASGSPGTVTDGTTIHIGYSQWFHKGFLDEAKFYNYVLSASQIKNNYNSRAAESGAVLGTSDTNENLSNGLVGYWKMDESTWTSDCSTEEVLDASGNSNNGESCPNGAANDPVAGKFGNAGSFDGTNDYVGIDDAASLDVTGDLTLTAWIKTNESGNGAILGKWGGAQNSYWMGLINGSSLRMYISSNGSTEAYRGVSGTSVNNNSWHHVAAIFDDAGAIYLYIDGVQQTLNESSGTIPTSLHSGSNALQIARDVGSGDAITLSGNVDEARVYNRALSPDEVSQLYNFAPGPSGYWKFDENTGTSAFDSSGNGKTGTLTNSPTWTAAGKYGSALTFDGSNDYVSTPQVMPTSVSAPFTMEAWVKPNSSGAGTYRTIIGTQTSLAQMGIWASNQFSCAQNGGGGFSQEVSQAITYGRWYHVVCVYDGANLSIYLDGVLRSGPTARTFTNASHGVNYIGVYSPTAELWVGDIDEAKIYNYARNAKQIVEDMNAGHPAPGSPVGSPVGYWKFDEGYGTTANNSGNGTTTGTITGSPAWTQAGRFGKALTFDGTNNKYVQISGAGDLQDTTDSSFTFSVWAKPTATPANTNTSNQFASILARTGFHTFIGYEPDQQMSFWIYNSSDTIFGAISPGTYTTGSWYHLVGVADTSDNKVKLYVNGVFVDDTAFTGTLRNYGSANYFVGKNSTGACTDAFTSCFTGDIDEPKIYNFALTPEQVKQDYNRGQSLVLGSLSDNSSYEKNAANQEYCVPGDSTSCAAPVGRWDFEEGTSTNAFDKSGNGNTGAITNATWNTGKQGKALNFDGSGDYVTVTDSTSLDVSSGVTIEAWVNPSVNVTSMTGWTGVVQKLDFGGAAANNAYGLIKWDNGSGKLIAYLFTNGSCSSGCTQATNTAFVANTWYHVAAAYNGSTFAIYVNGILENSGSATGTINNSPQNLLIGRNRSNEDWNGRIDQVKVFNYGRTASQIAWDFNKGAPVGWWKFDECQGTTVNDSSGNSLSGTITIGGTGTYTSAGTCASGTSTHAWAGGVAGAGKRNYALSFDGDDNVNMTDPASGILDFGTGDFTISAWAKTSTDNAVGADYIASKVGTGTIDGYGLAYDATGNGRGNQFTFTVGDDVDQAISQSTTTYNDGLWHHVVGVRTAGTIYLYVDGVLKDSDTASAVNSVSTAISFRIGDREAGSAAFIGQIDDTRVFNYALTATQVKTLYSGGAVNYAPVTGAP